jgi:protein-disulfide isomerase
MRQKSRGSSGSSTTCFAAEKQGKFWEFHDLLYENYNKLNNAKVIEISKELGLDVEKLLRDMKNPQILALISRDKREGDRAGVRGTPTIFINGRQFKDRRSLQGFGAVIDRELINAAKK